MAKEADYRGTVADLLARQIGGDGVPLDEYIATHSNLPGPAGNLVLMRATTLALLDRARDDRDAVWAVLERWADTPVAQVPPNDPRELLPFAAAAATGTIAAAIPSLWVEALVRLRRQARDLRWRTREAVAMGLQAMAQSQFTVIAEELGCWVEGGDLLEMRAVVAALAEPTLLKRPDQAQLGLTLHERVIERVRALPAEARGTEGFAALRKGLGYSLSVVAAALPEETFARMAVWATWPDKDVRWILKENLAKSRIAKRYPERVAELRNFVRP